MRITKIFAIEGISAKTGQLKLSSNGSNNDKTQILLVINWVASLLHKYLHKDYVDARKLKLSHLEGVLYLG